MPITLSNSKVLVFFSETRNLKTHYIPFVTSTLTLEYFYKKYINYSMKVVREKILDITIKVTELFDNTQDALTETKEGKIVSVDILSKKFIRNNIKLADATTNTSGSEATRQAEKVA